MGMSFGMACKVGGHFFMHGEHGDAGHGGLCCGEGGVAQKLF